jgi:hypothetical protein
MKLESLIARKQEFMLRIFSKKIVRKIWPDLLLTADTNRLECSLKMPLSRLKLNTIKQILIDLAKSKFSDFIKTKKDLKKKGIVMLSN